MPSSEAKIAANRANALKSTGPKTAEGKDRSRLNATKHGFCAAAVAVHGDDIEALEARHDAWQAELNPDGHALDGYLVGRLVRHSARLDRLEDADSARTAKSARDAPKALKEARMIEVDLYNDMLIKGRCGVAVRKLMLTPEGCQCLIDEWNAMRPSLAVPTYWDGDDHARVARLMGRESSIRQVTPGPLAIATMAITEHREVAKKLKNNEHPQHLQYHLRYHHTGEHQEDRDRVGALAEESDRQVAWLYKLLDDNIAALSALKAKLEAEDAAEASEVPYRALFDATDEGKLMHRYEQDAERALHRGLKELREVKKARGQNPQDVTIQAVAPNPVAAPSPPTSRNEPTERAADDPFGPSLGLGITGPCYVDVAIMPPKGRRNQR